MHITNNPEWQRADYVYDESGVGYPKGLEPVIVWKHIDGPLLYTSDCGLHWLTTWERIQMFFGWTDIYALDRKHQRKR